MKLLDGDIQETQKQVLKRDNKKQRKENEKNRSCKEEQRKELYDTSIMNISFGSDSYGLDEDGTEYVPNNESIE